VSSRIDRAIATFLNFYVLHDGATRLLIKYGDKYYIYFTYHLLLFPTVKEFSKSVNS